MLRTVVVFVRGETEVASWLVAGSGLAVVDELARLELAARRHGCMIRLRDPCVALVELLGLVGLRQVLGEAEVREQRGVEEVVVPDDPVA